MFEFRYASEQVMFHLKLDATMLWVVVQVLVLAGQFLNTSLK